MAFLSNATGRDRCSDGPTNDSMASATPALRMRGADVDCSRISVRAVRSHNPSRKATVGSVAPWHLAPCLTRWRQEGWHRLGHAVYHLGIRARVPLGDQLLNHLDGLLDLLVAHSLDATGMLDLQLARNQKRTDFHINRRLRLAHLFNRGRPVLLEVGSEREQEILVERSTRSLQRTARVLLGRGAPT